MFFVNSSVDDSNRLIENKRNKDSEICGKESI